MSPARFEATLLDAAGAPQQGAEGWGVREQDLDELGRVVEVSYLVSGDEAVRIR